ESSPLPDGWQAGFKVAFLLLTFINPESQFHRETTEPFEWFLCFLVLVNREMRICPDAFSPFCGGE
ncbi:MAG: hypothetical protein JSW12_03630, partial [Deltaproteobacteria bacterium]